MKAKSHHAALHPFTFSTSIPALHLPQAFGQTPLAKFPGIKQTLFGEVDALHVWCIGGGRTANPRSDHDRVGLEDDSVVNDLVNCE